MDIKRNNISETEVELTITASEARLKDLKKHTLEKMQPDVTAPGFRKGKVPLNVVEKQITDEALQAQFLDEAVSHVYGDAIKQEKLRVLEQPKIELKSFVPYTELTFTATLSVVPPVKLGDYTKIKKKMVAGKVAQKDIDEVIENLRTRAAEKKEVKREAKLEDEVVINFEGFDKEGKPVAGASGKDYPLALGSDTFIPGFEPEVIGLKAGDKKEFEITFPKGYAHKPLAGKKVIFKIEVQVVKEVVLPSVDDEFAKKLGPFDGVTKLKDDIKAELTAQKTKEALDALKDEIVGDLVKSSTVVVPEVLLADQVRMLREDFTRNLTYRGITLPEYLEQQSMTDQEFEEKELKQKAERRVQAGLVLAEVSDKEDIRVSAEELDIRLQLMAGQNPNQAEEFSKPEMKQDVGSRMLTEKTVDFLVEQATDKK